MKVLVTKREREIGDDGRPHLKPSAADYYIYREVLRREPTAFDLKEHQHSKEKERRLRQMERKAAKDAKKSAQAAQEPANVVVLAERQAEATRHVEAWRFNQVPSWGQAHVA